MKKIGIIINPVAGLGGPAGFKGSDSIDIQKKALEMGVMSEASHRASDALAELLSIKDEIIFLCASGIMGEKLLSEMGFNYQTVEFIGERSSTAEDTLSVAEKFKTENVDLVIFAGGDGTARNVYDVVGGEIPVIGVPAGVKIHSAVYAVNPRSAGKAAYQFLTDGRSELKDAEVMDIDEELFRMGSVKAKLYGYMKCPESKTLMQGMKTGGYSEKESVSAIASEIISQMEDDVYYVIGPGTTTREIMTKLGLDNTLLGVDVVVNKKQVAKDVNEKQLYNLIKNKRTHIIVTVIGGQGHVFGRGNQQISGRILKLVGKENIFIVAPKTKLIGLRGRTLIADTGDISVDNLLCGYYKIIVGYQEYMPYKLST